MTRKRALMQSVGLVLTPPLAGPEKAARANKPHSPRRGEGECTEPDPVSHGWDPAVRAAQSCTVQGKANKRTQSPPALPCQHPWPQGCNQGQGSSRCTPVLWWYRPGFPFPQLGSVPGWCNTTTAQCASMVTLSQPFKQTRTGQG